MITDNQILEAFLIAARKTRDEQPRIGVAHSHEWATTGRLAVRLARQPGIRALEEFGSFLDIEYGRMSAAEMKIINGRDVRIDMILHRRGFNDANLLACEVKMRKPKASKVDPKDNRKLEKLTTEFGYQLGIWIAFPRTAGGTHNGRYAIFKNGKASPRLQDL